MPSGRVVFSQLMEWLPRYEFDQCVDRYQGNHRVRDFSCLDQFLCMAYGQIAFKDSLRATVLCLRAAQTKLYRMGIRGRVSRSTLADANETRDWRIYADLAAVLIGIARRLYADELLPVDPGETAYAFDSTTIDLCLSLFPWAPFRKHKAAVKLHTLIDLRGSIPCFISVSDGKTVDMEALDHLALEPGAYYVMDRGYIDFKRLYAFCQSAAFFVVRSRGNLDYRRSLSREVDKTTGLRSDETISLRGPKTRDRYPAPLRRVTFFDEEKRVRYVFLTNNFRLAALTVADLYKRRWRVELFFKWIKQNLHIKGFFGTSANAVKTQIWIAISVYLLIAIVKKRLDLSYTPAQILHIVSTNLIEELPLSQAFVNYGVANSKHGPSNQLELFN